MCRIWRWRSRGEATGTAITFNGDVVATAKRALKTGEKLDGEGAVVDVVNGTRQSNLRTTKVADALAAKGLDAQVPPVNGGTADRTDYATTTIIAWNGAQDTKPDTAQALADAFGVKITAQTDPSATADFTVIVGSTTAPPS